MTTQEFVFDLPLYTKTKVSDSTILDDLSEYVRIDGYNSFRGVDSSFILKNPHDRRFSTWSGVYEFRFDCLRYGDPLFLLVDVEEEKDYIQKVGQYPSVADIHIGQVKKYRKVLGEDYIRDFTKAIGLAANGVGTGAFVYLRRVFEHLVFEIGNEMINCGKIDGAQFESARMDSKLRMLSSSLPDVILENKHLYSVLSAGIHTLSEEVCLQYFSSVKTVIELILDEREYARVQAQKKRIAKLELDAIAGAIKKDSRH